MNKALSLFFVLMLVSSPPTLAAQDHDRSWGVLDKLVGKSWVDALTADDHLYVSFAWKVPGQSMTRTAIHLEHFYIYETETIARASDGLHGVVEQHDGSIAKSSYVVQTDGGVARQFAGTLDTYSERSESVLVTSCEKATTVFPPCPERLLKVASPTEEAAMAAAMALWRFHMGVIGRAYVTDSSGKPFTIRFLWKKPGVSLVEHWYAEGRPRNTFFIEPSADGKLTKYSFAKPSAKWIGTGAADGSLKFVGGFGIPDETYVPIAKSGWKFEWFLGSMIFAPITWDKASIAQSGSKSYVPDDVASQGLEEAVPARLNPRVGRFRAELAERSKKEADPDLAAQLAAMQAQVAALTKRVQERADGIQAQNNSVSNPPPKPASLVAPQASAAPIVRAEATKTNSESQAKPAVGPAHTATTAPTPPAARTFSTIDRTHWRLCYTYTQTAIYYSPHHKVLAGATYDWAYSRASFEKFLATHHGETDFNNRNAFSCLKEDSERMVLIHKERRTEWYFSRHRAVETSWADSQFLPGGTPGGPPESIDKPLEASNGSPTKATQTDRKKLPDSSSKTRDAADAQRLQNAKGSVDAGRTGAQDGRQLTQGKASLEPSKLEASEKKVAESCRWVPERLTSMKLSTTSEADARSQVDAAVYPRCVRGPSRRLDSMTCKAEKRFPGVDSKGSPIKTAAEYDYRCTAVFICEEGKQHCPSGGPARGSRQ